MSEFGLARFCGLDLENILGDVLPPCAFGELRQNIVCLDLEHILRDVRLMSRAKK